jgi:hypothetical protein
MENILIDGKSYTRIKLPDLKKFKGKKISSPYEEFYNWIGDQFDRREGDLIDVSSIWISNLDDSKLRDMTLQWLIKYHKMSKILAEKKVPWITLQIAPAVFLEDGVDSNYAYVIEEKLFRKKNEIR